jgi:putative hemolysin
LGLVHPRLRTVRLPHELLNKRGKRIRVRIGCPIDARKFGSLSDREATLYLRSRTYLLSHCLPAYDPESRETPSEIATANYRPVRTPPLADLLKDEIQSLPVERRLLEQGEFSVYLVNGGQLTMVPQESGRLRELTFRVVGEGTGKACDVDSFDDYYKHLILWNAAKNELVGAYRMGEVQQILERYGMGGLYTSTLFHYSKDLFLQLGPALELGRSFVRLEYQRAYAPLMLLWKAIAAYVARKPETPVLLGAVSISNRYHSASRELIVRFFTDSCKQHSLSKLVRPRRPFRLAPLGKSACDLLRSTLHGVEGLNALIKDMEFDKELPILLKHYVKVGGELIGFNIDRVFSDVLDGLVVVDLRKSPRAMLERFMGRQGADAFLQFHTKTNAAPSPASLVTPVSARSS